MTFIFRIIVFIFSFLFASVTIINIKSTKEKEKLLWLLSKFTPKSKLFDRQAVAYFKTF